MIKELYDILLERNYQVYLRGEGLGRFLFVKGMKTSAEISEDNESIWIEFWESTDEEKDDVPIKDITCTTMNEVLEIISEWIR